MELEDESSGPLKVPTSLILDSGAFGAWTRGVNIDVKDYIDFCLKYQDLFDTIVSLDVIPGEYGKKRTTEDTYRAAEQSWKNYLAMKEAGIDAMPVFHEGDSFKWLDMMVNEGCDYIGVSPSSDRITMNTRWFDAVFDRIVNDKGEPVVKTHGFGVTSTNHLFKYPWYSLDSATFAIKSGYGAIFIPPYPNYKPGDPGEPDFKQLPISIWVTGASRKHDRLELENSFEAIQDIVRDFCERIVGVTMEEVRYSAYARSLCLVTYYKKVREQAYYTKYQPKVTLTASFRKHPGMKWDMKKLFLAVGNPSNPQRSFILSKAGYVDRLLSYWDLKDMEHEKILRYKEYGNARPFIRRVTRSKLHLTEYWNRRRILLGKRLRALEGVNEDE